MDLTEIPEAALRGGGGQQLDVKPVFDGDGAPLPDDEQEEGQDDEAERLTYDEGFAVWFEVFNTGASELGHLLSDRVRQIPAPGFVSWKRADDIVREAGRTDAQALIPICRCRTRHMHQQATRLPGGWTVDPQYIVDWDRYCARPRRFGEAAQNWFAVEVYLADLQRALNPKPAQVDHDEPTRAPAGVAATIWGSLVVAVGVLAAIVPGVPEFALGMPLVSWIAFVIGATILLRDAVRRR